MNPNYSQYGWRSRNDNPNSVSSLIERQRAIRSVAYSRPVVIVSRVF